MVLEDGCKALQGRKSCTIPDRCAIFQHHRAPIFDFLEPIYYHQEAPCDKKRHGFFHADHPFFYSEFIFEAKKHVTCKESTR